MMSTFASWETIIAEQHDIFQKHPKTTFINAHLGWYGNDLQEVRKPDGSVSKYVSLRLGL
jgi:predicted TIM-barrel fold metal-dependent hydrolase